jgi:hypothetical protein
MATKETNNVKVKASFIKKAGFIALAVSFLAAAGLATFFYSQTIQLKKSPADVSAQQVKDVVEKVSHLIMLPTDETPTLASVSDPAQLKNQPFFDRAEKGDQVLIYSNNKKAVLYRPSTNMVINFAPINIGPSTDTSLPPGGAPATPSTPVKK